MDKMYKYIHNYYLQLISLTYIYCEVAELFYLEKYIHRIHKHVFKSYFNYTHHI